MSGPASEIVLRVRYSETDQMGTIYNSRVLEWFECGRTEWLRETGTPYTEMERRGVLLPIVQAHVNYLGRARYDDALRVTTRAQAVGRARVRFDVRIDHAADGRQVAEGHTIHAVVSPEGRPIRPPRWFVEALENRRPE